MTDMAGYWVDMEDAKREMCAFYENQRLRELINEVLAATAPPNNAERVAMLGSILAESGWFNRALSALAPAEPPHERGNE